MFNAHKKRFKPAPALVFPVELKAGTVIHKKERKQELPFLPRSSTCFPALKRKPVTPAGKAIILLSTLLISKEFDPAGFLFKDMEKEKPRGFRHEAFLIRSH